LGGARGQDAAPKLRWERAVIFENEKRAQGVRYLSRSVPEFEELWAGPYGDSLEGLRQQGRKPARPCQDCFRNRRPTGWIIPPPEPWESSSKPRPCPVCQGRKYIPWLEQGEGQCLKCGRNGRLWIGVDSSELWCSRCVEATGEHVEAPARRQVLSGEEDDWAELVTFDERGGRVEHASVPKANREVGQDNASADGVESRREDGLLLDEDVYEPSTVYTAETPEPNHPGKIALAPPWADRAMWHALESKWWHQRFGSYVELYRVLGWRRDLGLPFDIDWVAARMPNPVDVPPWVLPGEFYKRRRARVLQTPGVVRGRQSDAQSLAIRDAAMHELAFGKLEELAATFGISDRQRRRRMNDFYPYKDRRNDLIRTLFRCGVSVTKLVGVDNLSERGVYTVLGPKPKRLRELDLFDFINDEFSRDGRHYVATVIKTNPTGFSNSLLGLHERLRFLDETARRA
jgi:hypothetical protein